MTLNEKIQEIKKNPSQHKHSFEELVKCCTDNLGAVNMALMEAHEGLVGPSRRCDVSSGPCACGGWH